MDIFRRIRVNGMKARERLGRTFLWGGRAGRRSWDLTWKKPFWFIRVCTACSLSGAQPLFQVRIPCPFLARLLSTVPKVHYRSLKLSRRPVIDAGRLEKWRGMLVRCSIRDKSIRIVFRLKRFPLYLRCVRFFKIKIQEITLRFLFFATKINIYYDRSTLITLCFIDNSNKLILRISEIEKNKLQELQTHKIFDINEEKPYLTFRIIEETYTKNSIETYYSKEQKKEKEKSERNVIELIKFRCPR